MAHAIRRIAPPRAKQAAKRGLVAATRVRSRADLARQQRELRKRYGPGLRFEVHPDDEMFRFMEEFWYWPHHVAVMRAPSDAMAGYLASGDAMMRDLEQILDDHGRALPALGSFLEFACGYGRFTRFLVARLDARRVTVSDISHPAVDFVRDTFGVSGFYSTEAAGQLDHDGGYEVIFVASLFSHLAIEHWSAWLDRLHRLLAPGGLLVFSTHGQHAKDVIYGAHFADQLREDAPGFWFLHTNETGGRLAEDYYGSAFVTEDYVRGVVAGDGLGTLRRVYPGLLWGSQDVYVLERSPA